MVRRTQDEHALSELQVKVSRFDEMDVEMCTDISVVLILLYAQAAAGPE
jgi:hypothetical protein